MKSKCVLIPPQKFAPYRIYNVKLSIRGELQVLLCNIYKKCLLRRFALSLVITNIIQMLAQY